MCGIVGYVGPKKAVPILLTGLKRLEYRGYDSAGVAIVQPDRLAVLKQVGKIAALEELPELATLDGTAGLAHTRWATHGVPNTINAHPHTDPSGQFAIVHNGIVENYHELKTKLEAEGNVFASATDSEVLAHLIAKYYKGDLLEAVRTALQDVTGTFGLGVVHAGEQRLVAARRGSPLIVGVGEGENLIGSDVSAVLGQTKRVIYLKDDELADLTPDKVILTNLKGEALTPDIKEVTWSAEQWEKGGFPHFMLKEITEQPDAVRQALAGRLSDTGVTLDLELPTKIARILIIACGTSWHAGLLGKQILEDQVGIPVEVDYASEFRYRRPIITKDDLVIAISQSGETADTLAAIAEAKRHGATTLGIVNTVGSSIAREVDQVLYLNAGPEIGVASTKAFTCQVVCLILLGMHWRAAKGEPLDQALRADLARAPELVAETLKLADQCKVIGEKYKEVRDAIYLGRVYNFPVALEGALKLKEISYVHAEGYPAAEMKHGPIALIDDKVLTVFVAPADELFEKIVSNMQEIKARAGMIVAVVNEAESAATSLADELLVVPSAAAPVQAILNNLPLQLVAYYLAVSRGIDVDKPRNLAKSVTVE